MEIVQKIDKSVKNDIVSTDVNLTSDKINQNIENVRDKLKKDVNYVRKTGNFLPILQLTEETITSPSDIELKNLKKTGNKFELNAINNTAGMFLADNKIAKKSPNEDMDEYLQKRKANEAAVRRFINDPENGILDELKKNSDGNIIKGAVVGFLYTLYAIFIDPIISDKILKRKILWRIIVVIATCLMAKWFAPMFEYNEPSYGVDNISDIYK